MSVISIYRLAVKFKKFFGCLLVSLLIVFFTYSCTSPCQLNPVSGYHFYLVVSPIDLEAAKQAQVFIANAKAGRTNIITSGNKYTVMKICEGDTPSTLTPLTPLKQDGSRAQQVIVSGVEQTLSDTFQKIKSGGNPCNATAASLLEVSTKLNDTAYNQKQGRLIILIQAPWKLQKDNESTFLELKKRMERLKQSGQVEKIIAFGMDATAPELLSSSFAVFNSPEKPRIYDSSTTIPQTDDWLRTIRRDNMRLECLSP